MHVPTGGVQELSSSTGDARRVEPVVVLVGTVRIADDTLDTALIVAQVMRVKKPRGTAGEAIGGRQVGLGEVEPGGAPASHVFVENSSTHERAGSGSIRQSQANARTPRCRHHKCRVGGTYRHWHLSQVAPEDTAGSVAGVSTVAMARSDDSVVDRGESKVRRCLWLRRLRGRSVSMESIMLWLACGKLVEARQLLESMSLALEFSQAPEPRPQVPGESGEHRTQRAALPRTWWPTTTGSGRAGRHDAPTPAPREGRLRQHHRLRWRQW
jgi:hypothetical protein